MNLRTKAGHTIAKARAAIAAGKRTRHDTDRRTMHAIAMTVVCITAIMPEIAFAGGGSGPWDTMGTQVLAIFTGGLTRTIAIISVIACGIAALAGKLSWDWATKIVVGIVLIFGGATIVDYLIAAAS
jgi:type IV secretory pathway VirB2 component (pilin)